MISKGMDGGKCVYVVGSWLGFNNEVIVGMFRRCSSVKKGHRHYSCIQNSYFIIANTHPA